MKQIAIRELGYVPYDDALRLMTLLHDERRHDRIPDTLLCLHHESVITRGRRLNEQPIIIDENLKKHGIIVRDADRGGLLTYHGPGQIVVYFIVRMTQPLSGVADMTRAIEKGVQTFLKDVGVLSEIRQDAPGVWAAGQKVSSIGLRIEDGVTRHGISLNVSNDLTIYDLFQPCGMSGTLMTNLQTLLGRAIAENEMTEMGGKLCRRLVESLQD